MKSPIKADTWVWVVVQNPGANEQFLGQYDQTNEISFIPAFYEKEHAQQCFLQMDRQKGQTYEIQAILYEELAREAVKNGFMIFLLNATGEILDKIKP